MGRAPTKTSNIKVMIPFWNRVPRSRTIDLSVLSFSKKEKMAMMSPKRDCYSLTSDPRYLSRDAELATDPDRRGPRAGGTFCDILVVDLRGRGICTRIMYVCTSWYIRRLCTRFYD